MRPLNFILWKLFPKTLCWVRDQGKIEGHADGYAEGLETKEKQIPQIREGSFASGRLKGFRDGMNHRRSFLTLQEEFDLPTDFYDYTDEVEREEIAQLVQIPNYTVSFRQNMKCQALKKYRDARLEKNELKSRTLVAIGDFIMDLLNFYDMAPKKDEDTRDEDSEFDL